MSESSEKTIKLNLNDAPSHAEALGHMTVAWSLLEFQLLSLFNAVSGMDRNRSRAIFYNLQSFRAKCDAIQAMAEMSLPKQKRDQMDKLLKKVRKTANKRNKYIHNPWATLQGEAGIWDLSHKAYVPTLTAVSIKDLNQTTQQIYQWVDEIKNFADAIAAESHS